MDSNKFILRRTLILNEKLIVDEYLSIPYVKPSVKELRFDLSKKLKLPKKKYFAHYPGAIRSQEPCLTSTFNSNIFDTPPYNISEDCLQLNIWVPKETTGAVIVQFYGDSYEKLSTFYDYFNGSVLAAYSKSIVVNVNFRLSCLELANSKKSTNKGNISFQDQQLALKWIKKYIHQFGGDKSKMS
uniref:COesterase domain-containing protein n=1 Tax=Parastrongyloides trichosuri TaxID=131310 RepID=A0A0N4Z5I0_PARTI